MLILDLIFRLKLKFPENFFYIKGNHDSFTAEINKHGYLQGVLFQESLQKHRGQEYVDEMAVFYSSLPYIVCSDSFIACHAGPPRNEITRDDINIASGGTLAEELTNNRLQRTNYPAGYAKRDVKRLRKCLERSPKTRVIVGHTPLDPFGSFWLHAGAIKNHHIVYSAQKEGPSVFIQNGNSSCRSVFRLNPSPS